MTKSGDIHKPSLLMGVIGVMMGRGLLIARDIGHLVM